MSDEDLKTIVDRMAERAQKDRLLIAGLRAADEGVEAAAGALEARIAGRVQLPVWERVFCGVLDTLTRALDGITRWIQR